MVLRGIYLYTVGVFLLLSGALERPDILPSHYTTAPFLHITIILIKYAFQHGSADFDSTPNTNIDEPTDEEIQLYCGALTVMALNFARFVRDHNPRYVAVAFDAGSRTFRNELFDGYKSTRKSAPLPLVSTSLFSFIIYYFSNRAILLSVFIPVSE